ncbi:apoptosis-associated speck-like protein containing a CARD [Pseudorasbora parva]|uniref:apoptosis-associated speck-like protein containing a CARD n=1 Tax=Pseudorasbora parva TaxID=51549 RepID=UPI00351F26E5
MVKTVKEHLENTFEDLTEGQLRKFKIKLRDRKEEPRVRQATIEKVQDALDLADLMVNTFTSTGAVTVTLELLEAIGCNEPAVELRKNTGHGASVPAGRSRVKSAVSSQSDHMHIYIPFIEHFIDKNWKELIDRANNLDAILDELHMKKVIRFEDYSNIRSEKTPQNKMRMLLTGPIRSAGTKGKDALYQALMEIEPILMEDLGAQ